MQDALLENIKCIGYAGNTMSVGKSVRYPEHIEIEAESDEQTIQIVLCNHDLYRIYILIKNHLAAVGRSYQDF